MPLTYISFIPLTRFQFAKFYILPSGFWGPSLYLSAFHVPYHTIPLLTRVYWFE